MQKVKINGVEFRYLFTKIKTDPGYTEAQLKPN
jgi:hypothetical protein